VRTLHECSAIVSRMFGAATTVAMAGAYAWWRRRAAPATFPRVVRAAIIFTWALASALEVTAVGAVEQVISRKFRRVRQLPGVIGGLWFARDDANPNRWFTRRTFRLLSGTTAAVAFLIITHSSQGSTASCTRAADR
jgi:hypothetical protein